MLGGRAQALRDPGLLRSRSTPRATKTTSGDPTMADFGQPILPVLRSHRPAQANRTSELAPVRYTAVGVIGAGNARFLRIAESARESARARSCAGFAAPGYPTPRADRRDH